MTYFKLTDLGHLPAGTDVAAVLRDGDERALHAVWNTFQYIRFTREALARLEAGETGWDPKVDLAAYWRAEIDQLVDVTALQALQANRRLVDQLTGRRWSVMQSAREAGASWSAIGDALEMSKQGALDWYKRKIADQEKYVPDFHDTARARAVLAEGE